MTPSHTPAACSFSRRELLARSGTGLGMMALATMLAESLPVSAAEASSAPDRRAALAEAVATRPLAPRPAHFPGRAKHLIHLFMNGGPSQVDTFDPKPSLDKYAGQPLPGPALVTERKTGAAYPSPFKFRQYGESGLPVSDLFPHVARSIDEICVIRSMYADVPNHEPSLMLMNSGEARLIRPSVGSWLTYGLGTENQNLPAFVAMCPGGLPIQGAQNWQSGFLPGVFQGTYIDPQHTAVDQLIEHIKNGTISPADQRQQLDLVQALNRRHQHDRPRDSALEARIQSFELAYRMQLEAAEAFDLSGEPQHILDLYGPGVQGRQMLLARRLIERGVRVVQTWHGNGQPWDNHDQIEVNHRNLARECDQAIGALLVDLKQRGLLDETLVLWGGEFGRTPVAELPNANGRDHNHYGFTVWLAGGGVRGGQAYGATDEFGFRAVENRLHVHDLHATMLWLLGFDHEQFTFRYAGRDFRLTDVRGKVIRELIQG